MRYFKCCFYLVFLIVTGCTYQMRHPQFSIAIYTNSVDEATLLRRFVADFSKARGFNKKTEAGNEVDLEKRGMYLQSYKSVDDSFVVITNLVGGNCYDIAIYSTTGSVEAQNQGIQLRKFLLKEKFADSQIHEQPCKGTHKAE